MPENGVSATEEPVAPDASRRRPYLDFPDIEIEEGVPRFAHDRGTITPVLGYYVAGVKTDEEDLLEAWVRHHEGWGTEGDFSEEAAHRIVWRFMGGGEGYLTGPTDNVRGHYVPIEPPKLEFREHEGRRWLVFTGIAQTSVSNHGAHMVRVVRVIDPATGARASAPIPGFPAQVTWTTPGKGLSGPLVHPDPE